MITATIPPISEELLRERERGRRILIGLDHARNEVLAQRQAKLHEVVRADLGALGLLPWLDATSLPLQGLKHLATVVRIIIPGHFPLGAHYHWHGALDWARSPFPAILAVSQGRVGNWSVIAPGSPFCVVEDLGVALALAEQVHSPAPPAAAPPF